MRAALGTRYGWICLWLVLQAPSMAAPVCGETQLTAQIQLTGSEVHFRVVNQTPLSLPCVDTWTWYGPGPAFAAFTARNHKRECLTVSRWAKNGWHTPSIFCSQGLLIPAETRQLAPGEVVDIPFSLETALSCCFWQESQEGMNRLRRETSEVKIRWGFYVNEACTQFVSTETEWLSYRFAPLD